MKKLLLATTVLAFVAGSAAAQVANISRTDASVAGNNLTTGLTSAVSPTYFDNDGSTLLVVRSTSGAVTITVVTQQPFLRVDGYGTVSLTDQVISVPSGATVVAGPFPASRWNTLDATVRANPSSVAGVSVTAVRVPR